jgi:TIR domain
VIAISYRREDSLPTAARLYDRLREEFGVENVFMDFDSIPYGADFRLHIKETIARSQVVVAIISPSWLGDSNKMSRRIDDPSDYVRFEITCALSGAIPIIPILTNNAQMPKADSLPVEIAEFAFLNALMLDIGVDFPHHTRRLIEGIRRLVKSPSGLREEGAKVPETNRRVANPRTLATASPGPDGGWRGPTFARLAIHTLIALSAVFALSYAVFLMTRISIPNPSSGPAKSGARDEKRVVSTANTSQATTDVMRDKSAGMDTNASREQINNFVKEFVESIGSSDIGLALSFYAPTVSFFEDGSKDYDSLRAGIASYNERWPLRDLHVRGDLHLNETVPNKEYFVRFDQTFDIMNLDRKQRIQGVYTIDLTVSIINGEPKISSIKRKILERKESKIQTMFEGSAPGG